LAFLRTNEAARAAGISKNTLLRWLKAGKVPEVARDRNGWRIFGPADVEAVREFAGRTVPPGIYRAARPAAGERGPAGAAIPVDQPDEEAA
jgi:hypothetical protein